MRLGLQTWYKTKDVSCPACNGTGKVAVRERGVTEAPAPNTDSYGHETLSTQDTAKTLAELDDGAEHLPEHLYDSEPTSLEGGELEYLLTFYVADFGADLLRLKTNEKADGGDVITALRNGIVERLMALVGDVKAQSYKQGQRDAIRSVIEAFSGEHPSSIVTGFVQEELQPWLKKRLDELNQGEEEDESI